MSISANLLILVVLILVVLLIGVIVIQVFLSKKEYKWFGLILPSISLLFSFLPTLNVYAEPGLAEIINFLHILTIFLVFNIPTAILLVIYFASREKLKKNKQIEKMNILDLE